MTYSEKYKKLQYSLKREASDAGINKTLVALSGGADSVATVLLLNKLGLVKKALHCNFHLRGEESNSDSRFVENFCQIQQLPLEIKEFDVEGYLKKNKGKSIEMACRELRYEWFETKLSELGADRIVTGHNSDDNIETLFLNLLRGSGTRGLKGMLRDSGKIWRPLLDLSREEILEYLMLENQTFVTDSTNLESDYRRNYLRNQIFPLLRKEWKGFDNAIRRSISNLYSENLIVEDSLSKALPEESLTITADEILEFPAPLLLIKRFIEKAGPFTTTPKEILAAINAEKPHIRRWRLKKGSVILRNRNLFIEMGHCE
ncbi:MAG: tRNA lysidine(34) synthetase TilS [Muribaculaceae bacterium]|nr:tRNA lysidine(34) synthetase TilS [Muribaculaceae bacterium]